MSGADTAIPCMTCQARANEDCRRIRGGRVEHMAVAHSSRRIAAENLRRADGDRPKETT